MTDEVDGTAGKFSVIVAILGFAIAVACFIIPSIAEVDRIWFYGIGIKSLGVAGALGLLLGIVGRKSSSGSRGIVLSLIALVVAAVFIVSNFGTQGGGIEPVSVEGAAKE